MSPLVKIAQQLAGYPANRIELGSLRPAAVLVPLFLRDGQPWLLLTRRAEQLKNHSGEISFPGGSMEAEDD